MRILLVGPEQEENLSIRYLSSSLQEAGHEVDLASFHCTVDMDSVVCATSNVDLVGLSMCFQSRAREYLELACRIKKEFPSRPVVAGGHYASCAAKDLLSHHPEIDLIVIHEGEQTLMDIAGAGSKLPQRLQQIKGIAYRDGNGICVTDPRPIIENLDSLPPPDRRGSVRLLAGVPTASMVGSRGCFGLCDYCCITTLHRLAPGKRFRQRSTESITDEMATLFNERGIRQFIFHDDNFLVPSLDKNHQRLDALESALANRGVKDIAFAIKCRPHEVDRDVFKKLQEMGLLRVFLGIESGSSSGLSSIGRRQTVAEAERALRICEDLGISSQYVIMIFHPDATIHTIRKDIAFMREYIDHPLSFVRVEAFAGTPLERRLIEEGRARGNYLARQYQLPDPAADLVCAIAKKNFLKRCWGDDNLMDFAIGMEHLAEIMKHFYNFYKEKEVDGLHERIHTWWLKVNRNSLDLLERLVGICSSDPQKLNKSTHKKIKDLLEEEAFTRTLLYSQGEQLRQNLDELSLSMVGLRQSGTGTIRIQSRHTTIARHAAAVMLALCVAGVVPTTGFSHTPASPLETDSDKDGLSDVCENKIFGTNPQLADTDRNGIPDGDEDHDGDGITNRDELNKTVELMDALETGDTQKVKALLEYSPYMPIIDDDGMTPLTRASYHGHSEIVQALVDAGAEVNAEDGGGRTALTEAAGKSHIEVVQILLQAGADVNARDKAGWTAMMWAARGGYVEAVQILLQAGADVDVRDQDGRTALMEAVGRSHIEVVQILLKANADVNVRTKDGKTALMLAKEGDHAPLIKLLREAGAKK
jgi:anaerobic magnesium-protoporphyrin IX monomethyl ester cyclase